MALETSMAFAAAAAVLLVIAGPTMLLVVSYALGRDWRAALPMALGVVSRLHGDDAFDARRRRT